MRVTFDPAKRQRTREERGLDFEDAKGKLMTVNKSGSRPTLKSDLRKVDAHTIQPAEYEELPELSEEMLARAVVNRGGRPRSPNPRKLITLRLPPEVIERWRATGPGWQTRMAERLSPGPATGPKSPAT